MEKNESQYKFKSALLHAEGISQKTNNVLIKKTCATYLDILVSDVYKAKRYILLQVIFYKKLFSFIRNLKKISNIRNYFWFEALSSLFPCY